MRTPSLIAGTVLISGLALAGQSESVVYTDGNLTGIATHTKAVLDLSQDKAMKLRVGRTDVSVPYSSITKSDAAADTTAVAAPGKKNVKPPQAVTVEFQSVQGDTRSMTLQMNKDAAAKVIATIHKHTPAETTLGGVKATPVPTEPAPEQVQPPTEKQSAAAQADQKPSKKADSKQAKADKKAQEKADKLAKNEKKQEDLHNPNVSVNDIFGKQPAKDNAWWGDNVWKTEGNLPKWQTPSSGATAAAQ